MKPLSRINRFKFLSIFGDGANHDWFNVVALGVNYLKMCDHIDPKGHRQGCGINWKTFETYFKKFLEDGLIKKVETTKIRLEKELSSNKGIGYVIGWQEYDYAITPKGDAILRAEQIARAGDFDYYKNFDRSLTGSHGLEHYAPLPNHLKEKGK